MFMKTNKTAIQILCLVSATALTGCSTAGNLTGGVLGSSHSSTAHESSAVAATLNGVVVAVRPVKVEVDSNGMVQSAIDMAGDRSAGFASGAVRSAAGYGGVMGMFGSVAGSIAGKAAYLVANKVKDTQAEDGVLVSVKLEAGPTIPIKQVGDVSLFHVGDHVTVEQTQNGSVSVKQL